MPRVSFRYKAVALGGTFDVFHRGHEKLVSKAFDVGENVLIGVTSDDFVKKLGKTHAVQPYGIRLRKLRQFLRENGWLSRATIAPLNDPYGPAGRRRNLEALVITPETLESALKLNQIRRGRGLSKLKIYKVKLALAEDRKPISSTRMRRSEIDRGGRFLTRK